MRRRKGEPSARSSRDSARVKLRTVGKVAMAATAAGDMKPRAAGIPSHLSETALSTVRTPEPMSMIARRRSKLQSNSRHPPNCRSSHRSRPSPRPNLLLNVRLNHRRPTPTAHPPPRMTLTPPERSPRPIRSSCSNCTTTTEPHEERAPSYGTTLCRRTPRSTPWDVNRDIRE